MVRHGLAVVGYVMATFLVQGLSHFVVFKSHYDAVTFGAAEPNFVLGLASMLIQGSILTFLFRRTTLWDRGLAGALALSWMLGAFLVSYIALAEPGKYAVPNIATWVGVEIAAGAVQFTLIAIVLWLAHRAAR